MAKRKILLGVLGIVLGGLLGLASQWVSPPGQMERAEESFFLPSPLTVPPFALPSSRGDTVRSWDFPGKLLVIFFGYTSCPDVCPLTLLELRRALSELGPEGSDVQVLFLSVDPRRDTPGRLARYLSDIDPSFLGLTGAEQELRAVAEGFGAYFSPVGEGPNYTVDHSGRVFVLNTHRQLVLTFPPGTGGDRMAADLQRLLDQQRKSKP